MPITLLNQENIKYNATVTLVTVKCCSCGVPFAMPEDLNISLQKTKDSFYCPNGHSQSYTKSTAEILRERLENKDREWSARLQRQETITNQVRNQRDGVIKERTVLKSKLTKVKNRIMNGVCPCCNRTFSNLAQHMSNQHPDFKTP